MMHPLFRYRTIGFSFFIEYDLFFPVHAFWWYNMP